MDTMNCLHFTCVTISSNSILLSFRVSEIAFTEGDTISGFGFIYSAAVPHSDAGAARTSPALNMTNGCVYRGGRLVENCELQRITSPVRMELSVTRDGCRALWSSNGQSVEYTLTKTVDRPFLYFLVCSLLSSFRVYFYPSSSFTVSHLCIDYC